MDYYDILYKAQENDKHLAKKEVRCYKTEFAPPKKVEKSKVSSASIQKFLARKEQEEREKMLEAQKKKEELLALRSQDKKAQKRVQVMLKRTKSANKSVMADAIDNVNTADTLNGPMQCDEDDYGYVSQEASAFYNKLMDKYQNMPAEKSIFSAKKQEVKDLNAAKDRVKAALEREAEEQLHPRRKRKRKEDDSEEAAKEDEKIEEPEQKESKNEPEQKKKKPNRPLPPPMDFMQLLKIAEKKQHEPIIIEKPIKEKEPERLMTQKEKMEYMKERERLKQKASGNKPSSLASSLSKDDSAKQEKKDTSSKDSSILRKSLNSKSSSSQKTESSTVDASEKLRKSADVWRKPCNISRNEAKFENRVKPPNEKQNLKTQKSIVKEEKIVKTPKRENGSPNIQNGVSEELSDLDKTIQDLLKKREMLAAARKKNEETLSSGNKLKEKNVSAADRPMSSSVSGQKNSETASSEKKSHVQSDRKNVDSKSSGSAKFNAPSNSLNKSREIMSKENQLKSKELNRTREKEICKNLSKDFNLVKKRFSDQIRERNGRKFPVSAVGRERQLMKQLENKYTQQRPVNKSKKRNVIDSESEYDSELDDFIDDGDEDIDYSQYIKEIFKYDKSRYVDDEEEDECMESNFAQQMREEYVSAKIGLLEDLEDIRKEQEEKERLKKKHKKKA